MSDPVHLRPGDMETICVGLASGDSLHKLVEQTGIPLKVFWRLMADDPALKSQYEFALQCKAQRWMEEAVEIADNKRLKGDDKRIQIDTRMKMAAKYFPEKFGEQPKAPQMIGIMNMDNLSDDELARKIAGLTAAAGGQKKPDDPPVH